MVKGRTAELFKRLKPARAAALPELPYFSYASEEHPFLKRLVIQAVEKMTGQPRVKRLYLEHRLNPVPDEDFWSAAVRKLELNLIYDRAKWDAVPKDGPLVIVANHPFGVLDGIVVSYLTSRIRPRFKVLTNSVLFRAPEVRPFLLPIDFAESREALATNIETRKLALRELSEGGAIIVFPGGTVSTAPSTFGRAVDPDWKPFTSKLIVSAKANVVPVYFQGQNSKLFQFASNVSQTLREALLFKEVSNKIGTDMGISIGDTIPFEHLSHLKDRRKLIDHLRSITYDLSMPR
ncbi:MAG: lysophospholipid acyltransferase family protein [Thalassobaculaceae bacterium]|nr:lysophospholipid acyltransferase family protein [Thalassobaculaceae bacterium]